MSQTQLFFEEDENSERDSISAAADTRSIRVLVPYPVDKAYDYLLPEGMMIEPGDYVCVPLGGREIPGVVWGEAAGDVPLKKLKNVVARHDIRPMREVQRKFIDWVARYTVTPKGSVLKMSLSVQSALEPPKPVKGYRIVSPLSSQLSSYGGDGILFVSKGLTPQRQKVLDVMSDGRVRRPSEIAQMAGCSTAVVKGLSDKGFLQVVDIVNSAPCMNPDSMRLGPKLSEDQEATAGQLKEFVRSGENHTVLLDGVTGAGKTEVYFEAVAQALCEDKQVLILLPEIALSNAFLDRFAKRFGCNPALWHSHLTPAQRKSTWRGIAQGDTKVVVGARSALFLPYQDLGLIIVDEEHDPAYKQEEGVIYHARDMAVVRGALGKFLVVLVSATPSLETIHNAWHGRYEHLHLPDRFGGARLPEIEVIDMRKDKPERQHFISPPLRDAIEKTLERGEQGLLFLNRRGYAPLTLCRTCGHRMNCPRCTAWLVEHKNTGRLHCHHCGFHAAIPKRCPECDDEDSFAVCGPGVERILEEVKEYFPKARTLLLASDTATSQKELREMLRQIREREVDIIIGTQIIAKGHHFPQLTLVGVIDADLGLQGGELRGAERVYQILHQVAGRAGREAKKGHVYLQSFMPEHKIMKALAGGSRNDFFEAEAWEREQAHMPPYSRLVGIIVAGRDEDQVIGVAKALGQSAPQGEAVQTLGPAAAPFARLRGRYRYRLLVRADKAIDIQKTVSTWVAGVKKPSNVRIYIDIDPQSFM